MEKKSAISERIQMLITEFCDGKNLPFAKAIGINESNIRSYIAGTQPRFDVLAAIADKFAVNCEWLLTGRGEMTKTNQSTPVCLLYTSDAAIKEQAEEIGILKQTIVQLKQESAGRVSGAESSTLAGVG